MGACLSGKHGHIHSGRVICGAVYVSEWTQSMLTAVAILVVEDDVGRTRTRFGSSLQPRSVQHRVSALQPYLDRKSTRLNSSHSGESRMPSSA